MRLHGINPVLEALRARRVQRLRIGTRADRRIDEIVALASEQRIAVERVGPEVLDRLARGGVHQGVIADVEGPRAFTVAELVTPAPALIVVLDAVEDPHNVGAILRTADAAGVTGVIRQDRHSAALDGVVGKASAGALTHVRIATVVNIARAIEELKAASVWTVGLAGEASESYLAVDFTMPTALVVGAEGSGLRRLVADRCDRLVSIPMRGSVSSLNVSVAAGVVLYEVVRQRLGLAGRPA